MATGMSTEILAGDLTFHILRHAGARGALSLRATSSMAHCAVDDVRIELANELPRAVYICANAASGDSDISDFVPATLDTSLQVSGHALISRFPMMSSESSTTHVFSGRLVVCSGGSTSEVDHTESSPRARIWVGADVEENRTDGRFVCLPVVPKTCHSASAAFVDGQLYLVGANRIRTASFDDDTSDEENFIADELSETSRIMTTSFDDDSSEEEDFFEDGLSETSECFDEATSTWKPVPPAPLQVNCCVWQAAGFRANQLSIRGPMSDSWFDDPLHVGSRIFGRSLVWRFDAHLGVWDALPPMSLSRTEAAVGAIAGMLYACGGVGVGGQPLATVERFNPQANIWEQLAPMVERRAWAAAGVNRGELLVCGGYGADGKPLSSAEQFDVQSGTWKLLAECPSELPAGWVR